MGASNSEALSSAPYTGRIGECAFRTGKGLCKTGRKTAVFGVNYGPCPA